MLNKDINYYFKKIGEYKSGRPKMAVDYDKLLTTDFNFFLIITERETRVKTYGAKDMCFKDWLNKRKLNTLWLRTKVDDIKEETTKFFSDIPKSMEKYAFKFNGTIASSERTKEQFIKIAPTSVTTARGSRTLVKFIVYDEFNIGVDARNWKEIVPNFTDLLRSSSNSQTVREQKVFLLGNNRSFNNPILVNLGIAHIDEEVSAIYDENGNPLILILFPIIDEAEIQDIKNENKDNPTFNFISMMGGAEHAYFNKNQFDDVNGIRDLESFIPYIQDDDRRYLFRVDNKILFAVKPRGEFKDENVENQIHWYCLDLLKNNKIDDLDKIKKLGLYCAKTVEPKPNDVIINKEIKEDLYLSLALNRCTFQDIYTKNLFYKLLK